MQKDALRNDKVKVVSSDYGNQESLEVCLEIRAGSLIKISGMTSRMDSIIIDFGDDIPSLYPEKHLSSDEGFLLLYLHVYVPQNVNGR